MLPDANKKTPVENTGGRYENCAFLPRRAGGAALGVWLRSFSFPLASGFP